MSNNLKKHGIYIKENKHTLEKSIILNGHLMHKYKYPKIYIRFNSPLVNDYNLHLVGGWTWPDIEQEECVYRVLDGQKPMGFYITPEKSKIDELVKIIKTEILLRGENDTNFQYTVKNIEFSKDHKMYEVGISITGLFKEIFNMPALIHDYTAYTSYKYLIHYTERIVLWLNQLCNKKIETLIGVDYANPKTIEELITVGLILGYPIGTTVSLLLTLLKPNI